MSRTRWAKLSCLPTSPKSHPYVYRGSASAARAPASMFGMA